MIIINKYDEILNYAKENSGYISVKESKVNSTYISDLVNDINGKKIFF